MDELTKETSYEKRGAKQGISSRQTTHKILNEASSFGNFVAFLIAFGFNDACKSPTFFCQS